MNNSNETTPKVEETVNENTNTADTQTKKGNVSSENNDTKTNENEIKLEHLDVDLVYDYMSVPTHSREEFRAVTYIILWARKNGIEYEFDKKGNVYLTKGELAEGEYYPCVTAHLDSVQSNHTAYAKAGVRLDVKTRINTKGNHEIYCDGFGIGGDDKAGVVIGLNMFSHFDKLKACFFLEEEIGCQGSKQMNVSWFDNVGYVIGYDSPDLNRAARVCSGEKLFTKEFFEKYMATIVKKWGLTDFRCEPFTDVVTIREKTDLICMNFGTGYYNCHMSNEYCVLEDMDHACGMGIELIKSIGNTLHTMERDKSWSSYNRWDSNHEDDDYYDRFNGKEPRKSTTYSSGYSGYNSYSGSTSTTSHTTTPTHTTNKSNDNNSIDFEAVKYISDKYEERIENIRAKIKEKCDTLNIDFDSNFKKIFETKIQF